MARLSFGNRRILSWHGITGITGYRDPGYRSKEKVELPTSMPTPQTVAAPSAGALERPTLFKIGVGLLVVHELIVLGLCALGGVVGALAILFGSLSDGASDGITAMVLLGGVAALLLMLGVFLAIASLAVCAMAWNGSRVWLQTLIGVALINCVLVAPNPLGVLAAVLCVLGALEFLQQQRDELGLKPATEVANETEQED